MCDRARSQGRRSQRRLRRTTWITGGLSARFTGTDEQADPLLAATANVIGSYATGV